MPGRRRRRRASWKSRRWTSKHFCINKWHCGTGGKGKRGKFWGKSCQPSEEEILYPVDSLLSPDSGSHLGPAWVSWDQPTSSTSLLHLHLNGFHLHRCFCQNLNIKRPLCSLSVTLLSLLFSTVCSPSRPPNNLTSAQTAGMLSAILFEYFSILCSGIFLIEASSEQEEVLVMLHIIDNIATAFFVIEWASLILSNILE